MYERILTKEEFHQLLSEASLDETRHMIAEFGGGAYTYFRNRARVQTGLLERARPIYFAALDWDNFLWTVVNTHVESQFSLFRYAKTTIRKWTHTYGSIKAVMDKSMDKNIRWTLRLGFKRLSEDRDYIELILRR